MPYNYQAPGLYIDERSTGPRPIESVATSVLAVVGLYDKTVAPIKKIGTAEPRPDERANRANPYHELV